MSETLYLVDAFSLIFQVFYAIPEMTGPAGQPTNAVYGTTRDLLYLLTQKRPDYLVCAFDTDGATVRHELYPEYKANRGPMPDELRPQIESILRLLAALEIPVLTLDGYEADDVIATVATEAAGRDVDTYVVTGDKDIRQLIGERIFVYNVRKDQVIDAAGLEREWGVRPEQVVDLLALTGDSVDNVPGVPGVGLKTAAKLLQKYGNLEGVLAHVDELTPKLRANLRAASEQVLLSRQLVRLHTHLPLEVDWEACRAGGFRRQAVLDLFAEYGFHRFAQELGKEAEPPQQWQATYRAVESLEQLRQLAGEIRRQPRLSIDTETTNVLPMQADLVGIVLAWQPGEAWYVPVRAPGGETAFDRGDVLNILRPILEGPTPEKVGHNLKYDLLVLRRAGVELGGIALDTMLASYLLEAGERNHSLDQLSLRCLDHTMIPISDLIGKGRQQKCMDEVPLDKVVPYACEDADVALRLSTLLEPRLHENRLWELYEELERPLIDVLAQLEYNGIAIDVPLLAKLSDQFTRRLADIEREIYVLAGRDFNIGSPLQLREVLFDELNLPVLRKTKTGASTDQSVLEELARDHPLPALLIEHRKLAKLKGTYLDALPLMVNPQTRRIHASFHQAVAATGRLSSSDPNLQNIPVRTEEGRQIRQAFVPGEPDWLLLTADYSQIELRMLAHLSGDAAMQQAFHRDEDIHAFVAGQIYGIEPQHVGPEMRRTAKMVNFGVIYGLSPFGLASRLGIGQEEAAVFIDAYFARYPGVEEFLTKILDRGRSNGYVSTILGRRRSISGIRSALSRQRNLPERTAINTVIQGSAADLIKRAMLQIHCRLSSEKFTSKMLLQIHDELVFETPPEEIDALAQLVTDEMTGALALEVPLKVDLAVGPNWLEVQPRALVGSDG